MALIELGDLARKGDLKYQTPQGILLNLSTAFLRAQEIESATALLHFIVKWYPSFGPAWYNLYSLTRSRGGNLAESIPYLQKAVAHQDDPAILQTAEDMKRDGVPFPGEPIGHIVPQWRQELDELSKLTGD